MPLTRILRAIDKVEKTPDGHLIVSGVATGPAVDRDRQRCDPEWVKGAMPAWLQESGAVREMHGRVAAGKGLGVEVADDGTARISALVVDPGSIAKVETGVLSMFSIGISDGKVKMDPTGKAPNGVICGGSIHEVSLVDLGSYKDAHIDDVATITKMASTELDTLVVAKADESGTLTWLAVPETAKVTGLGPALPLTKDTEPPEEPKTVTLQFTAWLPKVAECFQRAADKTLAKRKLTSKEMNDLPDSSFAYIEPGGTKDSSGKTVPRNKRHFAIHDAPHVRNALSRIGQGAKFGDKALPKVKAAAKKFGIDVADDKFTEAEWRKAAGDDGQRHDPEALAEIRQGLIDQMKLELDEWAQGEPEGCDVQMLLDSLRTFICWWASEAYGGETDSPLDTPAPQGADTEDDMGKLLKIAGIDDALVKRATDDDATDEDREKAATELRGAVLKFAGLNPEAVESLEKIAKALTTPEGEVIDVMALVAKVAEIAEMAAPGAPDLRLRGNPQAVANKRAALEGDLVSYRSGLAAASPDDKPIYVEKIASIEAELAGLPS